jgi:hypothetical protein
MKINGVLSLLLLEVAGHSSITLAQSPNTFTATGNMSTPRSAHTATLLTNGKVLIAGGTGPYSFTLPPLAIPVLASAELYDPFSGTFTATGSMATSRFGHTATLLPDGKVLIAGGARDISPYGNDAPVASSELYDPFSGTFTATGSMATSRFGHTATLLPDGKVLIAGGAREISADGNYVPVASAAELYDPSIGAFTGVGNLDDGDQPGDQWPSTTLLADGRVLIVGSNAHLYDPRTNLLSDQIYDNYLGIFYTQRGTLLMNGRVLFAGYDDDEGDFWGPELFDPSPKIFTATGNMNARRGGHSATLLPDGTVLIAGRGWFGSSSGSVGYDAFYSTASSAEFYDPATGTFSNTGKMAADRDGHTATLLNDGTVLIAGGVQIVLPPPNYATAVLSSAEIYQPRRLVPAPVLFSVSGDGQGQGAILHAGTHQLVSTSNPAVAGEALEIYGAGLFEGGVIPPQVAIGGRLAEILYFGDAPGYPGYSQVNFRVPTGVGTGSTVQVRLNYASRISNAVTIAVQ